VRTAQVWNSPAETCVAVDIPVTVTGVPELVVVELPSWPKELSPQHLKVPLERRAQECLPPAETCVAVVMPSTVTGLKALIGRVPSCR
jgi:hypothetical protein